MSGARIVFLHPALTFSSATARLFQAARSAASRGFDVRVLTGPGSRLDAFRAAGIDVELVEVPEHPGAHPFAARRTRRRIAELEPHLVLVTSERLAGLGARLGRPYTLELQRTPLQRLPFHSSHLRAVVVSSSALVESAVNRAHLPRTLVHVIEHGPEIPEELAGSKIGREGAVRVGCAGHLDADHGTDVFLEAARLLSVHNPPFRFLVFGEGPHEERLRRKARELAITDITTITAPAAPNTVELLSNLDIYASCLREGAPGWFAHQALGLGLPCIFSAASGSFSVVDDEESGLLIERGDAKKLADTIARLAENPLEAREMGARARRRVEGERRAERFADGLVELCESAIEDSTLGVS